MSRKQLRWTSRRPIAALAVILLLPIGSTGCGFAGGFIGSQIGQRLIPGPVGGFLGAAIGKALGKELGRESNKQWANCPACSTRAWWPQDGLRETEGRALCRCGNTFVITGYAY